MTTGRLTPTQYDTLRRIQAGEGPSAHAAACGITRETAKSRRRDLFHALGSTRQADALAVAAEAGLLTGVTPPLRIERPRRGHSPANEAIRRPDGRWWRYQPTYQRRAVVETVEAGPVVVALRTWNRDIAAEMPDVQRKWRELYGDAALTEGVCEWRRSGVASWGRGGTPHMTLERATGSETRCFPVLVFRPPAVARIEAS